MSSDVSHHVLYKIANAPLQRFPYPHILVEDVFPREFYGELRRHLPPKEAFTALMDLGRLVGYEQQQRFVIEFTPENLAGLADPIRPFWSDIASWMLGGAFGNTVMGKFEPFLKERFGDLNAVDFYDEALLVQDYTTYSLGPHTDAPSKVLSFLFYLPGDDSRPHLGTSMYLPKEPGFSCKGGPHHEFERFQRVYTMPYVPNTLFAFLKTDHSFHGVEPVAEEGVRRDLLLYDIRANVDGGEGATAPAASGAGPATFQF